MQLYLAQVLTSYLMVYWMTILPVSIVINHADGKLFFVKVKIISESCILLKSNIYTDIIT